MKITVKVSVEKPSRTTVHFSLEDLGVSLSEWEEMEQHKKSELIQKAVDEMPEQPYLLVDSWES